MNLFARSSNTQRKKHSIAKAIVCGILLVLPGCNIPKLRAPDPIQEVPESFNGVTSEENSSQVGIEESFDDPQLTNLLQYGLANSLQLKILGEEIQIANNETFKKSGAYLPFVSVGGGPRLDQFSRYTLLGADNTQ